jgi:monoamine oxidase
MNRTEFLKTLTAFFATSSALPPLTLSDKNQSVIVIGAGMAGLSAARQLTDQGYKVTILEGRNRIGGRIFTDRSTGVAMDMGAGWVHGSEGNNPLMALAQKAGADTFMTEDESIKVYNATGKKIGNGTLDKYYDQYEDLLDDILERAKINLSLKDVIQKINPKYLTDNVMLWQLSAFAEFDSGGAIEQLSSQYWEADEKFEGNDVVFPSGYDALSNFLSKGLDIKLDQTVTQIDYTQPKVQITTNKGKFTADVVVVTLPLGVLQKKKVAFLPALPEAKQDAIEKVKMGTINKVALVFPSVFWDEDQQYIGYTDPVKGHYNYFLNLKKFSSANALMTFALGNYGAEMEKYSEDEIRHDIMSTLRKIYGKNIPNPTKTIVSRWGEDPFAGGSYSYASVGTIPKDFEELAKAVENKVFFAGEHTHWAYKGTVHGAYLSGERVAKEVALKG